MSPGYTEPLYLLPFDHRHSYVSGMFHFSPPLTAEQHAQVADSKQLIYEGFRLALVEGVNSQYAGILVDEEFGAAILQDASRRGIITAMSTEQSGSDEFLFEYGADFARHIERFNPTFVKVLVRYNVEDDAEFNRRQRDRLKQLSAYCRSSARRFMFELLVPPTARQLKRVNGDQHAYDLELRPELMRQAIFTLQDGGVEPDIWKVEGLDRREDCVRLVEAARRDGRDTVSCILLGRGADMKKVSAWLETAASVDGFIGFAVGRTTFWDEVSAYQAKHVTRAEAAAGIAERYRTWVNIFERARVPRADS